MREADDAEQRTKRQLEIRNTVNKRLHKKLAEERQGRNLTPKQIERARKKQERAEQLARYRARTPTERTATPLGIRLAQKRERERKTAPPHEEGPDLEPPKTAPSVLQATRQRFLRLVKKSHAHPTVDTGGDCGGAGVEPGANRRRRPSVLSALDKISPKLSPGAVNKLRRASTLMGIGSKDSDEATSPTNHQAADFQKQAAARKRRRSVLASAGEKAVGSSSKYQL